MSPVRRPTADELAARPVDRVESLAGLVGADVVVEWCAALLRGGADPEDADGLPLGWLGGRSAAGWTQDYWPRVWAARIAAVKGDREGAVALIHQALREGYARLHSLHAEHDLESLRDFPAFREILEPRTSVSP